MDKDVHYLANMSITAFIYSYLFVTQAGFPSSIAISLFTVEGLNLLLWSSGEVIWSIGTRTRCLLFDVTSRNNPADMQNGKAITGRPCNVAAIDPLTAAAKIAVKGRDEIMNQCII